MASITSVVAFFVLLLATFSYSAPIGQEYGNSTPDYESTTNLNMDDWQKPLNMRPLVDDQSGRVQVTRGDGSSSEENEVTTVDVTRSPRTYEDSSYSPVTDRNDEQSSEEYSTPSSPKMNDKRIYEYSTYSPTSESSEERSGETYTSPASIEMKQKRNYEYTTYSPTSESSEEQKRDSSEERNRQKFSSPSPVKMNEKRIYEYSTYSPTSESSEERSGETYTSPSSPQMNQRRSAQVEEGFPPNDKHTVEDFLYTTLESSTEFNQRAIRPVESEEEIESSTTMDWTNQMKVNKDDGSSSSVYSFGKYTGLLAGEQSSTSEYETTEQPDEVWTQDSAVQPSRLTKTVSIIPGKITETKIYANAPSKTSVVIQPVDQEQLSQVQNQSVADAKESDN